MTLALRDSRILVVPRRALRAVRNTVTAVAPKRSGPLAAWQETLEYGADLIIRQIR